MLHRPARPQPCLAPRLALALLAPALLAAALVLPAGSAATQEVAPADEPLQVSARTVSFHSMLELDVLTADAENLGGVYDIVADPTDGLLKFLVVERTELSNRCFVYAACCGFHGLLSLTMALRVTIMARMTATMASFLGLPRATRAW
jgi:hypothetical protein